MDQLELIGFDYEAGSLGENYRGRAGDSLRLSGSRTKKRARAMAPGPDETWAWSLEPHVCRHCFGRLLSQPAAGRTRYLCSNCGAEAHGDAPSVLCACGLALRNHGPAGGTLDAGLRCQPNPAPSPDFPSRFVAAEPRT